MSTRGVIARKTGDDKFAGRYNHSDSYPSGLGRDLWNLYKVSFPGDLQRMLEYLIDEHPAGWSSVVDGECYCRDCNDDELLVTETNAAGIGCEWVYAFYGEDRMLILASYSGSKKMIGAFGLGDPDASWRIVADICLNSSEPDWEKLDG